MIVPPPVTVFLSKSKMVDDYDLSSLRALFIGAAPLSEAAADLVRKRLRVPVMVQGNQ